MVSGDPGDRQCGHAVNANGATGVITYESDVYLQSREGTSMTSRLLVAFVGAALLFGMTSSASAQSKWWSAERHRRELALTAEQSQRLEQIYQATVPKLRSAKKELDRQELQFSELMKRDSPPPENEVMAAIERLEAARSGLGRLRTLMLYQMRRVLTPEQRAKLEAEHQQNERDHSRNRGGRPPLGDDRPASR
jgi:Spy/CpxP family protein refolding chaperone